MVLAETRWNTETGDEGREKLTCERLDVDCCAAIALAAGLRALDAEHFYPTPGPCEERRKNLAIWLDACVIKESARRIRWCCNAEFSAR